MEEYKVNEYYYQIPFQVFFRAYPFIENVYEDFITICKSADTEFLSNYLNNHILSQNIYQTLKNDLFNIPDVDKYKEIEKGTDFYFFEDVPHWYVAHAQFQHKIFEKNRTYVFPEFHKDNNFIENVAAYNIKARGLFFYPKNSFREWHTNENDLPGMRYYLIYSDTYNSGMNFLINDKVVTVHDKPHHVNIFHVSNNKPLWHNVFSNCNRFSLGLSL
jgi:hypothetical protein